MVTEYEKFKVEEEGSYLDRMLDGNAPIWPMIELPGWDEPVRIRPLGRGIELKCHADAQAALTARNLDLRIPANRSLADEDAAMRILFEAVVTYDSAPDNVKRLASTYDDFASHPCITDKTIEDLWDEYDRVKVSVSPTKGDLSPERKAQLIEELKKNPYSTSTARMPLKASLKSTCW